jgi:glyoxylase-like metal-dependent hydrolase (beta-lactamase superfamily II)
MKYELIIVGSLETNCYLVYDEGTLECAVIDPGAEPEKIIPAIAELGLRPVVILNTHGHVDHVGANSDIKERFHVPLWIHSLDKPLLDVMKGSELSLFLGAKDSPPPDKFLKDREIISIGKISLKVVHTPGHTPGSVGFYGHGILFSGDTLFSGGVGRTDLPGGSRKDLEKSIRIRIQTLPAETVVLPGHGPMTTVGQEIVANPDLI